MGQNRFFYPKWIHPWNLDGITLVVLSAPQPCHLHKDLWALVLDSWNIRTLPLSWVGRACPQGPLSGARRCMCGPRSPQPPIEACLLRAHSTLFVPRGPGQVALSVSTVQGRQQLGREILGPPSGEVWSPDIQCGICHRDGKILWVCSGKPAILQDPRGLWWVFAALWPHGVEARGWRVS